MRRKRIWSFVRGESVQSSSGERELNEYDCWLSESEDSCE